MKKYFGCLGCLIVAMLLFAMVALPLVVMDGLTYGGLFKNPTWQAIRKIIGNNWGPHVEGKPPRAEAASLLVRPMEYWYYDRGQPEPIHVTDHTQLELTGVGAIIFWSAMIAAGVGVYFVCKRFLTSKGK